MSEWSSPVLDAALALRSCLLLNDVPGLAAYAAKPRPEDKVSDDRRGAPAGSENPNRGAVAVLATLAGGEAFGAEAGKIISLPDVGCTGSESGSIIVGVTSDLIETDEGPTVDSTEFDSGAAIDPIEFESDPGAVPDWRDSAGTEATRVQAGRDKIAWTR